MDLLPTATRAPASRRRVIGLAGLGFSSLVLPSAAAAASDPVVAPGGDQIGFRRATDDSRIEIFWFPASSASFTYSLTVTVVSAAAGSVNTADGDNFVLGPISTMTGSIRTLPDGRLFTAGTILAGEFRSTTSPPQVFTRTGHVWGTDTL